jgi:hypothetical protein
MLKRPSEGAQYPRCRDDPPPRGVQDSVKRESGKNGMAGGVSAHTHTMVPTWSCVWLTLVVLNQNANISGASELRTCLDCFERVLMRPPDSDCLVLMCCMD